MLITVNDFANERGERPDTIHKFLSRHPEIKTIQKGREKALDTESEAFKILDKKYSLPSPVEVIQDTESLKKLIKAQEEISRLKDIIIEQNKQLSDQRTIQLLLENKEQELSKKEEELNALKSTQKELLGQQDALQEEIDKLKGRSLFERISRKYE